MSQALATPMGTSLTRKYFESPACCRILSLNLKIIDELKDTVNTYLRELCHDHITHLTGFNCLAAIFWHGIIRATAPSEISGSRDTKAKPDLATLTIPVDVRRKLGPDQRPELGLPFPADCYIGNTSMHATVTTTLTSLTRPFDVASIVETAKLIHTAVEGVTEDKLRQLIREIAACDDVRSSGVAAVAATSHNLVITSWADLPLDEAHLGLMLRPPQWGRKISRAASTAYGCIVLPVSRRAGVWEVIVQVTEEVMGRLVMDKAFMRFVKRVA